MKIDLFIGRMLLIPFSLMVFVLDSFSQESVKTDSCLIKLEYSLTDVSCWGGDDGAIDLQIINATNPEYLWSNGEISEDLNILIPGKYSVTVNDGDCSATLSVIVNQPASNLALHATEVTDITCPGYNDGKVKLTAAGGTEPYEFGLGDSPEIQADDVFEDLQAGLYTFNVRDKNSCTATVSVTIEEPESSFIDIGEDIGIRSGEVIPFDAGQGFTDYLWSTGETTQSIDFSREVTKTTTESISVDAVDENGCRVSSNQVEVTIIPVSQEAVGE